MTEIAQQEIVSIAILAAISLLLNVYLHLSKSRLERETNDGIENVRRIMLESRTTNSKIADSITYLHHTHDKNTSLIHLARLLGTIRVAMNVKYKDDENTTV